MSRVSMVAVSVILRVTVTRSIAQRAVSLVWRVVRAAVVRFDEGCHGHGARMVVVMGRRCGRGWRRRGDRRPRVAVVAAEAAGANPRVFGKELLLDVLKDMHINRQGAR